MFLPPQKNQKTKKKHQKPVFSPTRALFFKQHPETKQKTQPETKPMFFFKQSKTRELVSVLQVIGSLLEGDAERRGLAPLEGGCLKTKTPTGGDDYP